MFPMAPNPVGAHQTGRAGKIGASPTFVPSRATTPFPARSVFVLFPFRIQSFIMVLWTGFRSRTRRRTQCTIC